MNYFEFHYKRYKKRKLIRKLIDDYEDLKECLIYAQINNVDFYEFLDIYIWSTSFNAGVCLLINDKYDKNIRNHNIWINRHTEKRWFHKFCGYWCKPLHDCIEYDELTEAIQKRIDILYTELHNPKI